MITLLDIKTHMLKYMSMYSPINNDEVYDEDGHCGDGLWIDIKNYWNNFKSNKDFLYVVSGKWCGDIDLGGGRSYIFNRSNIIPLLFDYMYNTLGYNEDDYDKVIFNSIDLTDELLDMFDNISVIRDTKINSIINNKEEEIDFVEHPNDILVLKFPKEIKKICDLNPNLKFIGYSKIDESPIYKIEIPSGGEIVQTVNNLISC